MKKGAPKSPPAMRDRVLQVGDVLSFWQDTGAIGVGGGVTVMFARVLTVGAVKIKVRDEAGNVAWKYPRFFLNYVPPARWADLEADGVSIPTG